jgi:hypothetical protein
MPTSRAQYDADRIEDKSTYTEFPTAINQYALNCGICNRTVYVDKQTYRHAARVIEQGLDNPFLCDYCQDEYAELERSSGH